MVATSGFDPLLDQGEAYARALAAAGVAVTYRRYDSLAHGFTAFAGLVPAAADAGREVAGLVGGAGGGMNPPAPSPNPLDAPPSLSPRVPSRGEAVGAELGGEVALDALHQSGAAIDQGAE